MLGFGLGTIGCQPGQATPSTQPCIEYSLSPKGIHEMSPGFSRRALAFSLKSGYLIHQMDSHPTTCPRRDPMPNLLKEVKDDVNFVKSHTLQPKRYKFGKIFILLGVLIGYYLLFGLAKTAIFLAVFLFLSLVLHMLYRVKTHKFTRSWLDFVVVEEDGQPKAQHIGAFYYVAIVINLGIAIFISQLLA
jgi:hypothetical protein